MKQLVTPRIAAEALQANLLIRSAGIGIFWYHWPTLLVHWEPLLSVGLAKLTKTSLQIFELPKNTHLNKLILLCQCWQSLGAGPPPFCLWRNALIRVMDRWLCPPALSCMPCSRDMGRHVPAPCHSLPHSSGDVLHFYLGYTVHKQAPSVCWGAFLGFRDVVYSSVNVCTHLVVAGIVCVLYDNIHICIMYTYAWCRACILLYNVCTVYLYVLKMLLCSITQDDGVAAAFSTQLENGLVICGFPSFSIAMA